MSKRSITILVVVIIIAFGLFGIDYIKGVLPLLKPVPSGSSTPSLSPDKNKSVNTTGLPLKVPDGFSISTFAENLPGARVLAFDSLGNLWVSQTSEGATSLVEVSEGKVKNQYPIFQNLKKPHGLAFDPDDPFTLYAAEEDKISRVRVYSEGGFEKVADLPDGGHFTRTIGFGPDKRLYVSIGSSCNVCDEKDNRRAKIFSMNKDGSDFKEYARGLRNAVFFTWHPQTKKMWATEMGRDLLGDDIPPDEINVVEEGKNYGWPICYGKNIHDTDFNKNTYLRIRNPCMEPFEIPSYVDLQAHSAPLGLAFVTHSSWPAEYRDDLIVAFHGSWNRSAPTGYKLVRVKLDGNGNYQGTEDFIAGWLSNSQVYGRPVDVVSGPDGSIYVSDDRKGTIYKIEAIDRSPTVEDRNDEITLVFVGDIMLSRNVGARIAALNDYTYPFKLVKFFLSSADITFANLESPISSRGRKVGSIYSFRADPRTVGGLTYAGFDIVSIANNHIWDYGREAFLDTLSHLASASVDYVGGGHDFEEAHNGIVKEIEGVKIGFLAYTNLLPALISAKENQPGAALLDETQMINDIEKIKEESDLVAVSFHWGDEYKTSHNQFQERVAKKAIEAGADLIIGHHPHVVQEVVEYSPPSLGAMARQSWIAYSLGNFIFDQNFSEETMMGLALKVKVTVKDKRIKKVEKIQVKISKDYQPSI